MILILKLYRLPSDNYYYLIYFLIIIIHYIYKNLSLLILSMIKLIKSGLSKIINECLFIYCLII